MRLHFSLSSSTSLVPFSHYHALTGRLHRWLGNNELHDGLSLYSLSGLQGGGARDGGLVFPRGATFFLSAPDTPEGTQLIGAVAGAALQDPEVCYGMEVVQIHSESTPEFGSRRVFRANSPIFIRGEKVGDKDPHILFSEPELASELMTKTLRHKLDKAGLGHLSESVKVEFDLDYKSPKIKLIHVKENFYKKASVCPVLVEGEPEAVRFAWNCGIGNLTGSGFGSLV